MTNKHAECLRAFVIKSEAWYASLLPPTDKLDEISIGMYHPGGGTTGEFAIRWHDLARRSVPRLEVFHDGWDALLQFRDVLDWLASVDGQCPTPQDVAAVLRSLGVQDRTDRTNPRDEPGELEFASWLACLRAMPRVSRS